MYFALISSPENLAKIDRYREICAAARASAGADRRRGAASWRAKGKAFVHIDGGLHATEVAGPQHTPQLAYDLVSKARRAGDARRCSTTSILMLWPTINPDGQQMVAEWYMKNVGTPYELSGLPQLYQEYVGHDNNRDAYMLNMVESRVIEHTWRQWEPQIIYVHHQTGPFPTRIWLPPFSEPVGIDAPLLMSREVNMIGMAIAKGLEERGQVGATHMGTAFDAWYPGYIDYAPIFKNIAAFWTETALYPVRDAARIHDRRLSRRTCATCGRRASTRARGRRAGGACATPSTTWKRRRSSTIEYAAKYKDSLLFNRYQRRPRSDRARDDEAAVRLRRPAGSSAIRSPPSSCCAASRSAACASRS